MACLLNQGPFRFSPAATSSHHGCSTRGQNALTPVQYVQLFREPDAPLFLRRIVGVHSGHQTWSAPRCCSGLGSSWPGPSSSSPLSIIRSARRVLVCSARVLSLLVARAVTPEGFEVARSLPLPAIVPAGPEVRRRFRL